jgi:hypothetical protein
MPPRSAALSVAVSSSLLLVLIAGRTVAQVAGAAAAPPSVLRHEIVRGTVTGAAATTSLVITAPAPKPLDGVDVIVTRGPDRAFKSAKTDAAGQYLIDWPDGTGDYLVHVAAPGYETFRKRVTRSSADTVFVVDAPLKTVAVQQLGPVVTTARKAKPDRNPAFGADVGASEQLSGGMVGKLPPDLAGDLAAIAGAMPGVTPTAGGISVLGLGPDQNSTTLNGMAFAGSDIPRDANTRVRVSASAYDPARGWFSGANTNVELAPGNLFGSRRSHLTLDAPTLQYTDPVSARLGQRFIGGNASYGADGELIEDKWYYNIGLQGGRRSADVTSLVTADADLLRHAGVSSDSAAKFLALLRTAGIPNSVSGVPTTAVTDNISFIGRFDHTPFDPKTLAAAKTTWGLTAYARLARSGAVSMAPTATPAHSGKSAQDIGSLQAQYSTFFGNDYLADARSSFTVTRNQINPYLAVPEARVRVESDFADDAGAVASLQFGGNSGLAGNSKQWTWENATDIQFYASGTPRHRVKLSGDLRLDGYSQTASANSLGTFSYNSLADLATNSVASFTRTINAPLRQGAEWNAFLAASDLWRINPAWQILYGARVEGNAFTGSPMRNPLVAQQFAVDNDYAPNSLHVSPRFGFNYNRTGQIRNTQIGSPLGNFSGTTPGVLRGGIGEFRGLTPATLLSSALVSTGLPGSQSRLSCIGGSVPRADWTAFGVQSSAIPSSCAGGISTFADAAPSVVLFDRAWSMARSWRSNLAWQSIFKGFNYTLEGIYSLNLNQPGAYDLNFRGVPFFTLLDEGRPMFAPAASIVPATGLVSGADARVSPDYSRIMSIRGDGRSVSKQATLTVSPNLVGGGFSNFYVAAGYTLSSIRTRQRGFDASTFGSPTERTWTRGDLDARHQVLLQGGYATNNLTFTMLGRLQSGIPFTPLVGGDVNGDGLANDRAFIPDPARASDAALAQSLRALIAASPSQVRACLSRQFNHPAGAASCEGPWTASLNTRLGINGDGRRLSRRVNVGVNLSNPLGGLDQLIHGSDGLRGWGTAAAPDPVLFSVRGWDAAAKRFQYSVNPRFGNTRPSATTLRAPFRLTLDVSIDVGRQIEEQQVDRWLKPGRNGRRGVKADAQDLKRRYDRNVPDLYAFVLQQSDSLLLSRDQAEALQKARTAYRLRMDSVWTTLANYLAELPDNYDAHAAYRRADDGINGAWELTRADLQRNLPAILNPVQLQLVPSVVKTLINSTGPLRIRIFLTGG